MQSGKDPDSVTSLIKRLMEEADKRNAKSSHNVSQQPRKSTPTSGSSRRNPMDQQWNLGANNIFLQQPNSTSHLVSTPSGSWRRNHMSYQGNLMSKNILVQQPNSTSHLGSSPTSRSSRRNPMDQQRNLGANNIFLQQPNSTSHLLSTPTSGSSRRNHMDHQGNSNNSINRKIEHRRHHTPGRNQSSGEVKDCLSNYKSPQPGMGTNYASSRSENKIDCFDGSIVEKPRPLMNYDKKENTKKELTHRRNPRRPLGFQKLKELTQSEPLEIMRFFSNRGNFEEFSRKDHKFDFIVLFLQCLAKISLAEFDSLKGQLLVSVCKSEFLNVLRDYLLKLPHTKIVDKKLNRLFWDNGEGFFQDLFTFLKAVTELSPSTAVEHFKVILDVVRMTIEGLRTYQKIEFTDETIEEFENLQTIFILAVTQEDDKAGEELKNDVKIKPKRGNQQEDTPPDDFRKIEVLPKPEELFKKPVFLRPNIVDGAYQDVEHYLDVQFRLLREDFIGPLRDALREYRTDDRNRKKRRYGSARFYSNTKVLNFCETRDGSGVEICFDQKLIRKRPIQTNKKFDKNKMKSSKRFLYGSLLLLTSDNFESILFCSVVDSDEAQYGVVKATINQCAFSEQLLYDTYLMLESDIYFPPYQHILKALQKPSLVNNFPFEDYIIHGKEQKKPPAYLNWPMSRYQLVNDLFVRQGIWPTHQHLGFNPSQFEAYQTGLTREFVTIQGPPGTGKTFIGLKIVETLLRNINSLEDQFPPILVVCYTNHALDQFLEGISRTTEKIIRIGGQSKNENISKYNLKRCRVQRDDEYYEDQRNLERITRKLEESRYLLEALQRSHQFLNVTDLVTECSLARFFDKFQEFSKRLKFISPLLCWLAMTDCFDGSVQRGNVAPSNVIPPEEEEEEDEDIDEDDFEETDDIHRQRLDLDDVQSYDKLIHQPYDTVDVNGIRVAALKAESSLLTEENEAKVGDLYEKRRFVAFLFHLAAVLEERLSRGDVGYDQNITVTEKNDAQQFNMEQRWSLYWKWCRQLKTKCIQALNAYKRSFDECHQICDERMQTFYLRALRRAHIVGITTSGAARLQSVLRSLNSAIVVVEEAAEVLETHVVASLTKSCQHLIMIGDHQQLRPITASYTLSKHYNLDISLFERMVNMGTHCVQLNVQHRMRPEISKLITPAIYPHLQDHPSVGEYEDVIGVKKNLFFITHNEYEKMVEDSVSRINEHEADFCLSLAKYLVQQNYDPNNITILATYSGQMFHLREKRKNINLLRNVHIVVLDNYQGQENDIIILSLVRSNAEKKIGFLSTNNRVCVALSRARKGFYIIGNMDILKTCKLWNEVNGVLGSQGSIGESLELQCQIHQEITLVKSSMDFSKVAEGGCQLICNTLLSCGHTCIKLCHVWDREHEQYKCRKPCEKIICELNHKCQSLCFEICKCMVRVNRVLKCGHQEQLPCSTDHTQHPCNVLVEDILPDCKHKVQHRCKEDVNNVMCPHPCEDRLPCGHKCRRMCHKKPTMDPDHAQYCCREKCTNLNKGCTQDHPCQKECNEECDNCTIKVMKIRKCGHSLKIECCKDVEMEECTGKCKRMLKCGHHCKDLCKELCDETKCIVKMTKVRPFCKHNVEVPCGKDPDAIKCSAVCDKLMPCGHKCKRRCFMECDPLTCDEMVLNVYASPCGHSFKIPCKESKQDPEIGRLKVMKYCAVPCKKILKECEHTCAGTCGKCWHNTFHVPCTEPCNNKLVCGHVCKEPCRLACPPCKERCEISCEHSKCGQKCGLPCAPCKEPCKRSCPHGKCKKLCGEECDTPPCDEPCGKMLKCKHPCRGLCGEVCPEICKICKPEEFPEIFFGEEDEDDARFIKLNDCPHVVEVSGMDMWMKSKNENEDGNREIGVGVCPMCSTRIKRTKRYSDFIKINQKGILAVKHKVYGKPDDIHREWQRLEEKIMVLNQLDSCMRKNKYWSAHLLSFEKLTKKQDKKPKQMNKHYMPNVCLADIRMYDAHLDILQELANVVQKDTILSDLYVDQFLARLFDTFNISANKISEQQSEDINNLLEKFKMLVKITEFKIFKKAKDIQIDIFFCFDPFDTKMAQHYINKINGLKLAENLVLEERKMIVAALGFKQGHWYTCPNGHPYCIADCGGAVVTSTCNECGAEIGGTGHRLLGTNRVATFMDGATQSAWPGNYNMLDYADY